MFPLQTEKNLLTKPMIEDLQLSIESKYEKLQQLESQLLTQMAKQEEVSQVRQLLSTSLKFFDGVLGDIEPRLNHRLEHRQFK